MFYIIKCIECISCRDFQFNILLLKGFCSDSGTFICLNLSLREEKKATMQVLEPSNWKSEIKLWGFF